MSYTTGGQTIDKSMNGIITFDTGGGVVIEGDTITAPVLNVTTFTATNFTTDNLIVNTSSAFSGTSTFNSNLPTSSIAVSSSTTELINRTIANLYYGQLATAVTNTWLSTNIFNLGLSALALITSTGEVHSDTLLSSGADVTAGGTIIAPYLNATSAVYFDVNQLIQAAVTTGRLIFTNSATPSGGRSYEFINGITSLLLMENALITLGVPLTTASNVTITGTTTSINSSTSFAGALVSNITQPTTTDSTTRIPTTNWVQDLVYSKIRVINNSVSSGLNAGLTSQGADCVAIGNLAGENTQGLKSVAIGFNAGRTTQGATAIAIGALAGLTSQGASAIALGNQTARLNQSDFSVALGAQAGYNALALNAIAIGYLAAYTSSVANSICLNGTGATFNPSQAGFFVKPLRGVSTGLIAGGLYYDSTTGELQYSTSTTTTLNASTATTISSPTTTITGTTTNLNATTNNINGTNTNIASTGTLAISCPTTTITGTTCNHNSTTNNIAGTNTNITSTGTLAISCPTTTITGTQTNLNATGTTIKNPQTASSSAIALTIINSVVSPNANAISFGCNLIGSNYNGIVQTGDAAIIAGGGVGTQNLCVTSHSNTAVGIRITAAGAVAITGTTTISSALALTNGSTATTQAATESSTNVATTAYVNRANVYTDPLDIYYNVGVGGGSGTLHLKRMNYDPIFAVTAVTFSSLMNFNAIRLDSGVTYTGVTTYFGNSPAGGLIQIGMYFNGGGMVAQTAIYTSVGTFGFHSLNFQTAYTPSTNIMVWIGAHIRISTTTTQMATSAGGVSATNPCLAPTTTACNARAFSITKPATFPATINGIAKTAHNFNHWYGLY